MDIKGYWTNNYYMGYVNGEYIRFDSESAYKEYIEESEDNDERDDN